MLIRPLPFPNELDRSYLGRMMRFNGVTNQKDALVLMRVWTGVAGKSYREVSTIELLSRVAGTSLAEFVRGHSTLPLRRGITRAHADLEHGSSAYQALLWTSAMKLARPGAYCCEQCVMEDQNFHGQSYWRLEHQIPGLFWCPKHGTALRYLKAESSFLISPATCIHDALPIDADWVAEAQCNRTIQRFLGICSHLMDRQYPLDEKMVFRALYAKARESGFNAAQAGPLQLLLSDKVIREFGRSWLSTIHAKLADKPLGAISTKLDGILMGKDRASSIFDLILASAVLFETAEDSINAFEGTRRKSGGNNPSTKRRLVQMSLGAAYAQANGNYIVAATLLGGDLSSVSDQLSAKGLPNLARSGDGDPLKAAMAFFNEGRSIAGSAKIGGISRGAMEGLVRLAGRHLGAIWPVTSGASGTGTTPRTGRNPQRGRQRTPLEACGVTEREAAMA